LRPAPNQLVVERITSRWAEIATCAPVVHELTFGFMRLPPSRRREAIERYVLEGILASAPVLPYDRVATEWHAAERARLAGEGRTPPTLDGQIAAIAATTDLILVTFNLRDFQHFRGLRIEDWRS
jgi:tRNA(fMet)-specific endonuclease VapC